MSDLAFHCSCGASFRVLQQGPTEIGDGALRNSLSVIRGLHAAMGHTEATAQEAAKAREATA